MPETVFARGKIRAVRTEDGGTRIEIAPELETVLDFGTTIHAACLMLEAVTNGSVFIIEKMATQLARKAGRRIVEMDEARRWRVALRGGAVVNAFDILEALELAGSYCPTLYEVRVLLFGEPGPSRSRNAIMRQLRAGLARAIGDGTVVEVEGCRWRITSKGYGVLNTRPSDLDH